MKRDQVNIQHYTRPEIRVLRLDADSQLMHQSGSGGHQSAGNEQVLPGAKQGFFDEEDTDDAAYTPYRVWEE